MNRAEIRRIINEAFGDHSGILNENMSNAALVRAKKALISNLYSNGMGVFNHLGKELDSNVTVEDMHANNNKWRTAIKTWASDAIDSAYAEIFDHVVDGKLNIYRKITLDENNEPDAFAGGEGVYWTWDKKKLFDVEGKWIFHAEIPLKLVEWSSTLTLAADPATRGKKELRLVPAKFEYKMVEK